MSIRYTTKILPSRSNHLGIITLNHPTALHALTLDMIHCIQDVVLAWCSNSNTTTTTTTTSYTSTESSYKQEPQRIIKAILFKSSTFDPTQQKVRAFCAGGNVKDVYYAGMKQDQQEQQQQQHGYGNDGVLTSDFFRQEYIMNHMLSQLNGSTVLQHQIASSLVSSPITATNGISSSGSSDTASGNTTGTGATGTLNANETTEQLHQHHQHQQQLPLRLQRSRQLPIQISFWDGMVMGGGIGISLVGKYRIATEHTVWSMPETAIGLFPDVGSMYLLPRMITPPNLSPLATSPASQRQQHAMCLTAYLLLTGTRLQPYDIVATGLATHFVPSQQLPALETALIQATTDDDDDDENSNHNTVHDHNNDRIGSILDQFHTTDTTDLLKSFPSKLVPHMDDIVDAFTIETTTTMEQIVQKLQQRASSSSSSSSSTSFAQRTITTLLKMSPTSLKITLRGLQRNLPLQNSSTGIDDTTNEALTFEQELQYEYRTAQHCMRQNRDFYEGIRATLIDKDHTPKWSPTKLSDVTDDLVSSYMDQPIAPHEWELPLKYDLLAGPMTDDSTDGVVLHGSKL